MVPVHIWAHYKVGNLSHFPEYFYEHRLGRETVFDLPELHPRRERLNYSHVGEFAQVIYANVGKPSVHIFVLSPDDLLGGPLNNSLGLVCSSLMKVAWTCQNVATLFVNFASPKYLNYVSDTSLACNHIIEDQCKILPQLATVIVPRHSASSVNHRNHILGYSPLLCLYKDLVEAILTIKLSGRRLKIDKPEVIRHRNDSGVSMGMD
jgi:hypothetical protein